MTAEAPIILHLPAGSVDWAGIITQFTLHLVAQNSKQYATWAGERLLRATRKSDGVVALADGALHGLLLFEVVDQTAELTLPWTLPPDHSLATDLTEAVLQVLREDHPELRYIRAERQLLPGNTDPGGLEAAGFACYWRRRMMLELADVRDDPEVPVGYRITHWHIRYLDHAAEVVYRANLGTLDAELYAPFFGDSPAQCRKGLLAILAGRYGPIHPQATLCAFCDDRLVGINLVISEGERLASIVEVSVDPAHQRRRLGRALLQRSLRVLKHENYERVELAVTQENRPAIRLYQALGFTNLEEFPVCFRPRAGQ
ncbi:MAG: GNAT family N-acetyltransferase [Armatimonadota bacterium]